MSDGGSEEARDVPAHGNPQQCFATFDHGLQPAPGLFHPRRKGHAKKRPSGKRSGTTTRLNPVAPSLIHLNPVESSCQRRKIDRCLRDVVHVVGEHVERHMNDDLDHLCVIEARCA